MDDRLKELMQELGNAINEQVSDSERIAAAIDDIKTAGYNVFLLLEAIICYNKREENEAEEKKDNSPPPPSALDSSGKIKWTGQDHKFLKGLKVSLDGGSNEAT